MRTAASLGLLLWSAPAWAGFSSPDRGTSGAQFLKLGAGARAEGMGGAFAAAADDASAMYWNPAALPRIEGRSATLMHAALLGGVNYDFAAYGQSLGPIGAAGASLQYSAQPLINETDSSGFLTGNTFHPNDFAAALGFAHAFQGDGPLHGTSFGLTGKYIQSTLTRSASTYGVDLGWLSAPMRFLGTSLRLAFIVENLGGQLKFQQVSDPLPLTLRFGSGWTVTDNLLFTFDFDEPQDNSPYFAVGGEYRHPVNPESSVLVRAGFNTNTWGSISNLNGVAAGLGGRFRRYGLDYAFSPMGSLGINHRISVNFSF